MGRVSYLLYYFWGMSIYLLLFGYKHSYLWWLSLDCFYWSRCRTQTRTQKLGCLGDVGCLADDNVGSSLVSLRANYALWYLSFDLIYEFGPDTQSNRGCSCCLYVRNQILEKNGTALITTHEGVARLKTWLKSAAGGFPVLSISISAVVRCRCPIVNTHS